MITPEKGERREGKKEVDEGTKGHQRQRQLQHSQGFNRRRRRSRKMMFTSSVATGLVAVLSSLALTATAHPGENLSKRQIEEEAANAHVVNMLNTRALEACQNDPDVKAYKERAIARRAATFARLRQERGLEDGKFTSKQAIPPMIRWGKRE